MSAGWQLAHTQSAARGLRVDETIGQHEPQHRPPPRPLCLPSQCTPVAASMPTAISLLETAFSLISARSLSSDIMPPPSITNPNLTGKSQSLGSAASRASSSSTSGVTSSELGGISTGQRADDDVARCFSHLAEASSKPKRIERVLQRLQALRRHAAELQVAPAASDRSRRYRNARRPRPASPPRRA